MLSADYGCGWCDCVIAVIGLLGLNIGDCCDWFVLRVLRDDDDDDDDDDG